MRLRERFKEEFEFLDLLKEAENAAESAFDVNFTDDIRLNYEKYGMSMFISEKQINSLKRIAHRRD